MHSLLTASTGSCAAAYTAEIRTEVSSAAAYYVLTCSPSHEDFHVRPKAYWNIAQASQAYDEGSIPFTRSNFQRKDQRFGQVARCQAFPVSAASCRRTVCITIEELDAVMHCLRSDGQRLRWRGGR
jgi:hypothetical protein